MEKAARSFVLVALNMALLSLQRLSVQNLLAPLISGGHLSHLRKINCAFRLFFRVCCHASPDGVAW